MADDWRDPRGWSGPRWLLVGLIAALLLAGAVGASTSPADFGVYDADWDGAADLRGVAEAAGADVSIATETTAYADADPNGTIAVVLAPDRPYDATDRRRVGRFVERGGTLLVAADFGGHGNDVAAAAGASARFDGRPLRDERNYHRAPALPIASNVTDAPETEGVDRLTLNHGTAVVVDDSREETAVLVRSSRFSYLDADGDGELDDDESLERRPVLVRQRVGAGTVYVLSDPSVFLNAMLERPGNERLAANLFGAHERAILDLSHRSDRPPAVVALATLRATPWLQSLVALVGVAGILRWRTLRRWTTGLVRRGIAAGDGDGETADAVGDGTGTAAVGDDERAADREALVALLERRHPDWDRRRIRRVIGGVLPRGPQSRDDE
ncbi:DUF4350 domain-containing protein [Halobaculum sp. CBA1158]|uniref:DUF4350 domain-containing protein n=1 Tax=Halobaculum sp. CBA1158 TaxID=2904243 RepID=UPI001F2A7CDB|nr:DUF4350 domain-containing protein [Halobaculum sp. CBA1158]UIO99758.1 DUF4350 domain-containing protein [Halobaculum sp. CBA1158]